MSVNLYISRYRILLIFVNFNFDFLALYKIRLQNYFADRPVKLESFTSHLQHSRPRRIKYTTLANVVSVLIKHAALHVVYICLVNDKP